MTKTCMTALALMYIHTDNQENIQQAVEEFVKKAPFKLLLQGILIDQVSNGKDGIK